MVVKVLLGPWNCGVVEFLPEDDSPAPNQCPEYRVLSGRLTSGQVQAAWNVVGRHGARNVGARAHYWCILQP